MLDTAIVTVIVPPWADGHKGEVSLSSEDHSDHIMKRASKEMSLPLDQIKPEAY